MRPAGRNGTRTKDEDMSKTTNEQVAILTAGFKALSKSRQSALKREAKAQVESKPHTANHSTFWKGMSAAQILAA